MKGHLQPADSLRLVFDWASRQDRRRRLVLWVLVAVVLHGGAIFLLGYAPPPMNIRSFSDATLYIAPPAKKALEAYVAASDPALFAPGRVRDGLLDTPALPGYRPSFDQMEFKPLPLPREEVRVMPTLDASLMDALAPARSATTQPEVSVSQLSTQIRVSDNLIDRIVNLESRRSFSAGGAGDLRQSVFLIAVDSDGGVRHAFPRSSSGDERRDLRALEDLMQSRFAPTGDAPLLEWGTVTIFWGADAKAPE